MKTAIIATTCFALLATTALAQQIPQPPAATLAGAPAGQQIGITGIVKEFVLTPAGDIEGIVLANGIEVHVPPHLTTEVAAAVRPGEAVAVRGWSVGINDFIVATALTGQRGQSVVDQGPPPRGMRVPPPREPTPGSEEATVQGRIQQVLHGPRGDINGAMLDSGTTVKVPPHAWPQVAALLQPRQTITAQGWILSNAYGRVIDVQAIGLNPGQLTDIAPPDGPGRRMGPPPPASGRGAVQPPPAVAPPVPPAANMVPPAALAAPPPPPPANRQ
jgi:hypothetical protein